MSVRTEGLTELRAELRKIDSEGELLRGLREAHRAAADVVAQEAARRAPRRTGALRSSIRALARQTSGQVAAGKAKVPYAAAVEFGYPRRNIPKQPYIFPAIEAKSETIVEIYADGLQKLMKKAFPD